jgi:hypothetical protein
MPNLKKPSTEEHLRATSERMLPSLRARPRVILTQTEIDALELSDGARRALPHIDGHTTVHELIEKKHGVENIFDALDELEHEGVIALSRR